MKNPNSSRSGARPAAKPSSRASAPPDPLLGMQLGEFVIQERIGAGGMGVVYRAEHPLIGKQAAIKVMRMELVSQQQVQRLLLEARAVNAVRHPGIIDIFGFGTLPDERPYVTMELLQGRPLSDFVRGKRRMDLESVVWVMDQMLAALGAAHRAGVVHRDLKPANVFIVEAPETPVAVKLVDFGIAKLLESRDNPLTADGLVLGTPEFMSPEQIRGDTVVGPATDLYAAGVMMFQLLTGVRPFQGESVQVMFAHLEQSPPLPSSHLAGLPKEVDALVLQLLAKNPASRPHSAEAVRQQLKRIPLRSAPHAPSVAKPEPVPPTGDSLTPSTREALKAIRQPPGIGWALLGALVLLSVGAGVIRLRAVPPPPPVEIPVVSVIHMADAGPDEPDAGPDEPDAGPDKPDAGPDKSDGGRRPPKPPGPKKTPKPSTSLEAQQNKLLGQISAFVATMRKRNGGRDPMSNRDSQEQLDIMDSISKAKTQMDLELSQQKLDAWKRRLEQRFPAP
ncbi:serine/threonine protein kinase [Corallococcus macrosporus]|uniref:Serine/threonine protein kinase n=2 Tax=Corallococcus macrosporus TaxID=35 RepID=A0ABS3D4T7_9BACT|nr:serine/threonine-protein kinase [Corallococcus macrosporus]MBN8226669.1 serine/threonine protein kinase [Corallococcus macrosporus]